MSTSNQPWAIRRARTADIRPIAALMEPLVETRVLLGKDLVVLFESVQEFTVAIDDAGNIVGCGALHVFWEDLGEIRTLTVDPDKKNTGIGHALLEALELEAKELGLTRLFCLSFETDFFTRHGFRIHDDELVDPEVYAELVRSPDEGVAEFLDLARVKPNTLGNSRLVKNLD
ncbi:MAG: N-acetylglutamate synthase [Microbacteriaceae bacterium BACL25 MAG-120322-bin65]|nr:MAG: N-acetylglutamate synthase [Microbacteriaceae bacterium BACL25 MAG-120322-bin65]